MLEWINNLELAEFLRDHEEKCEVVILEEGKEKKELLAIAKAKGINLSGNRDLAGIKVIYTFADKANTNKARLPKRVLLKALPTMIGKPINIDHIRKYVIGYYIDYRYIQKDDKVIGYGIIFKSNFQDEWKKLSALFKAKKLTTSYEIWCPKDKRMYREDGTYELTEQDIAGGAIMFRETPAFEDAKVLEVAKKTIESVINADADLVYASKYKEEDVIFSNTVSIEKTKEEEKVEEKAKQDEPKKQEPEVKKEEPKVEDKQVEQKAPEGKPLCGNCKAEIDMALFPEGQGTVKCPKCFAVIDRTGKMVYPPQIIDFDLSCPNQACTSRNWLLLEKAEKTSKVKCLSCAKEYEISFEIPKANEMLEKIPFIYQGSASCLQCGRRIEFSQVSSKKLAELKCKKCGLAFSYNTEIGNNTKKKIVGFRELESDINKSSVEGGKSEMEYILEVSKYHREVETEDFDKYAEAVLKDDKEGIEEAKVLTTEQRNKLPDNMFAVVIRVKNKITGKTRKIRKYPIHDEAHVRNALARLGQEAPKAELQKLGVSINSVMRKILKRAKELKMDELLKKHKEQANRDGQGKGKAKIGDGGTDVCVCPKCGYTKEHEKGTPCTESKCPKCDIALIGKKKEDAKINKASIEDEPKEVDYKAELTKAEEDIRQLVFQVLELKKTAGLEKASTQDRTEKLIAGIKKLSATVIELKSQVNAKNKDLETAKIDSEKQVNFYKENAKELEKRRNELGEEFAGHLTDEDLMNSDKYDLAVAKKENAELAGRNLEIASTVVGDEVRTETFYSEMQQRINERAGLAKKK
ncbi:MAG: hypothetical protein ACTSPD_09750 [Promethearchaeota archaeon]